MMRVVAHPVPSARGSGLKALLVRFPRSLCGGVTGACVLLVLVPSVVRGQLPAPAHHQPGPRTLVRSWLGGGALLTMYGRAFGVAPILGDLGQDNTLGDVARQLSPARQAIRDETGRPVRLAIHLIYALAVPCTSRSACLIYLDDTGVNLVKQYIEPAARRGWLVILDDQLGRSSPTAEMQRLIRKGYLAHDNVEVAFDPEFRTAAAQYTPGVPTGFVSAAELNAAQAKLDSYCRKEKLAHRKLLLVHEWTPGMVRHRAHLRSSFRYVQPVAVMDGIGSPADKTAEYTRLLGRRTGHLLPGIKLFPTNLYDPTAPIDTPLLTWAQIFGCSPISAPDGTTYLLRPVPRVIVFT